MIDEATQTDTATAAPARSNVFDIVTQQIIAALERGTVPWRKRFSSPYWLTYRQARERAGQVRKGEKGAPIFFWKVCDRRDRDDETGPDTEKSSRRFVARYYTVFNVEQCDGLEYPMAQPTSRDNPPVERCDELVAGYAAGPEIRHGGQIASYSPIGDVVRMPERNSFHTPEAYYSTLFHELTHSTGHPQRLARFTPDEAPPPFGSPDYSREELIAELGAAFLSAQAGISNMTLENSTAYIAGWLRVLKADRRAVVFAAGAAGKAAGLIGGQLV